ncbi:MAG: hypothetical protein J7647_31155 [Cyanobacteria bacterium SBLK]|nr:hypothetical protein [Cyanobacteria bacterium SBLK]
MSNFQRLVLTFSACSLTIQLCRLVVAVQSMPNPIAPIEHCDCQTL